MRANPYQEDSRMPPGPTRTKLRRMGRPLYFYAVRLPLIYSLIGIGFLIEFGISFPWIILTSLDRDRRKITRPGSSRRRG
ncbi:MAG TPA: hypothetical protein VKO20_04825 [Desulfosalsimonadaceae bacterium]|nr:hypothetical protein [Desulfosalsimonadaceae bacterium]